MAGSAIRSFGPRSLSDRMVDFQQLRKTGISLSAPTAFQCSPLSMARAKGGNPPEPMSICPAIIASRMTGPEVSWRQSTVTPGACFSMRRISRITMSGR